MKIYRVYWASNRGTSYVEAESKEEALRKADNGDDFFFMEDDTYEVFPSDVEEVPEEDITPEEIEEMKAK